MSAISCTIHEKNQFHLVDSLQTKDETSIEHKFIKLIDLDLTPQQYVDLFNAWLYKYVKKEQTPPWITSNAKVDRYLQQKAEARGYRLRTQAEEERLVSLGHLKLQSETLKA